MNKEVGSNKEVENLINGLENREILELIDYLKGKYNKDNIDRRKLLCEFKDDIENNIEKEIKELISFGIPPRLVELSTLKLLEECCNNGYELDDNEDSNFRSFLRIQLMYLYTKSKRYFNRLLNMNHEYLIGHTNHYNEQYESIKKFFNSNNLEESSIYLKLITLKIFDFNNPKLFGNIEDSIERDRKYINYLIKDMK